jgi:acyl-CoA thioesterase
MREEKKRLYFKKVEDEPYARFLNIKLKDVDEGYALCEMEYKDNLDNLYGIAHGGAIFSLIDEAFEISSNSYENVAVALNMNVTYIRPPKKNTILKAESREIYRTKKTASYYITVRDDENLLAVCQAIVYIKDRKIPFLEEA